MNSVGRLRHTSGLSSTGVPMATRSNRQPMSSLDSREVSLPRWWAGLVIFLTPSRGAVRFRHCHKWGAPKRQRLETTPGNYYNIFGFFIGCSGLGVALSGCGFV